VEQYFAPTQNQNPDESLPSLTTRGFTAGFEYWPSATQALNASPAAAIVLRMSSSVCAAETNAASNCEGAR
jgi:hypothetical protein